MRRLMVMLAVLATALVTLGAVAAARVGTGLVRTTVVVGGLPVTLVRQSAGGPDLPGAVVVHGFAGSARLVQPIADTLARNGCVVVLPDLAGHGASTGRLADPAPDVDTAGRFLRAQAGVDAASRPGSARTRSLAGRTRRRLAGRPPLR